MKKLFSLFTVLFFTFLLIGCSEGKKEVVQAEKPQESTDIEQVSMLKEIADYSQLMLSDYSELSGLVSHSKKSPQSDADKYEEIAQDGIIRIELLDLKPSSKSEQIIYDQFSKVLYHVDQMYSWTLKYLNTGESTYKNLFVDSRSDIKVEYELLEKMFNELNK